MIQGWVDQIERMSWWWLVVGTFVQAFFQEGFGRYALVSLAFAGVWTLCFLIKIGPWLDRRGL